MFIISLFVVQIALVLGTTQIIVFALIYYVSFSMRFCCDIATFTYVDKERHSPLSVRRRDGSDGTTCLFWLSLGV